MKKRRAFTLLELIVGIMIASLFAVTVGAVLNFITRHINNLSSSIDTDREFLSVQTNLENIMARAYDIAFTALAGSGSSFVEGPYNKEYPCSDKPKCKNDTNNAYCGSDKTVIMCSVQKVEKTVGSGKRKKKKCEKKILTYSCKGTSEGGFVLSGGGAIIMKADMTPFPNFRPQMLPIEGDDAGASIEIICCDRNMEMLAKISSVSQDTKTIYSSCTDNNGLSVVVRAANNDIIRSTCYSSITNLTVTYVGFSEFTQSAVFQYSLTSNIKEKTKRFEFFAFIGNNAQTLFVAPQSTIFLH